MLYDEAVAMAFCRPIYCIDLVIYENWQQEQSAISFPVWLCLITVKEDSCDEGIMYDRSMHMLLHGFINYIV